MKQNKSKTVERKRKIGQTSYFTFNKYAKKITEKPSNSASKINIEARGMHKDIRNEYRNTQ